MQTIKIEIFDEDVIDFPLEDLAIEISKAYRDDDYPDVHIKVTDVNSGKVYEVNQK